MIAKIIPLLLLGFAASFGSPTLKVAVTLPPYQGVLQSLGGERVEAIGLVPPGTNPHTWEPTPATLKAFSNAHLYFTDSTGMDLPWLPRFKSANFTIHIIAIAQGVQRIQGHEEHGEDEHHQEESSLDPHLWSSPRQMISIAVQMSAALMAYDTAGIAYYKIRLAHFLTRAYKLDAALRATVAALPKEQRHFLIFHPSYGYLARDYGLTQLSVEIEGKEPKPADLAHLVKVAKENEIRTIFVQPQFSVRSAQTLAREIKGNVSATDPLSQDWEGNLWAFIQALQKGNR